MNVLDNVITAVVTLATGATAVIVREKRRGRDGNGTDDKLDAAMARLDTILERQSLFRAEAQATGVKVEQIAEDLNSVSQKVAKIDGYLDGLKQGKAGGL